MKHTIKFHYGHYSSWQHFLILFFLFIGINSSLFGQASPKMAVTPEDYGLWSTMDFNNISDNGNWVSYNIRHTSGKDTLWVRHTKSGKTFNIPGGHKELFIKEDFWMGLNPSGQLALQDLKNEKRYVFDDVAFYDVAAKNRVLILADRGNLGGFTLRLINLKNNKAIKTFAVTAYSLSESGEELAYATYKDGKARLISISMETFRLKTLTQLTKRNVTKIVWEPLGTAIAFTAKPAVEDQKTALYHYDLSDQKLTELIPEKSRDFPIDRHLRTQVKKDFYFSEDGESVFIALEKNKDPIPVNPDIPEVWNTLDKRDYPRRAQTGSVADWEGTAVWHPKNNSFFWFTEDFTDYRLIPKKQMALVSSIESHKPQFINIPNKDYYLVDLKKKTKKLLLSEHLGNPSFIRIAPSGNNMLYFNEKGWYTYDIASNSHRNITATIPTSFIDREVMYPNSFSSYGFGGFTKDEKSVLLYDKYDIWEVSIAGNKFRRLTRGKENKRCFKFFRANKKGGRSINLNQKQILKTTSHDKSIRGYYIWDQKEKPWIFENNRSENIKKAKNKDVFVYVRQDFTTPPALMVVNEIGSTPKLVFQSNVHYKKYAWGKAVHINYRDKNGSSLKGCLFYPASYDPDKKYPMIVDNYSKQAHLLHLYENPSWYNSDGMNISNLIHQGFFVLLPDIAFNDGTPGMDAVDCVTAAVATALKTAPIDAGKVGLNGHSFGGYVTNFLLTQTDLFATAISGASFSDYISSYFSISPNYGKAEYWRYENFQMRMGVPFFQNKERYIKNSPVYLADRVNTPLLLWTGKQDTQVPPTQSEELFLALRRLRKPAVMLQYPEQGHTFFGQFSQKDLTQKMERWYAYYLKDSKKPSWILPN